MIIFMSREDKLINLLTIKWNPDNIDAFEIHTICQKSFVQVLLTAEMAYQTLQIKHCKYWDTCMLELF